MVDAQEIRNQAKQDMELFVGEVMDFCQRFMPESWPREFFEKMVYDSDVRIPEIFPLLDSTVRTRVEYVVYRALVEAAEARGLVK